MVNVARDPRVGQHGQELADVGLPDEVTAGLGVKVQALAASLSKALEILAQFRIQVLVPQGSVGAHPGSQAESAQPPFQGVDISVLSRVPWQSSQANPSPEGEGM
ncbi:hypothetical protein ACFV2N_18430 [Streptomyces sp. NPDC059680]|uniref:hypothetical protein n=1 Tax=Streptomyces sp. NPDC059680 TaxID=3346904 RepID=UPI00369A42A8